MARDWSKLDQVADMQKYNARSRRQMYITGAIIVAVIVAIYLLFGS